VGSAFSTTWARKELDSIASDPPRDHVFQVNNFGALDNIQNQLQEKIFAIEGTQTGSSSSFQHEMSQEGFSALLTPDGPVLGDVGSFDWSGGVSLYPPKKASTFINVSQKSGDMHDAYLGYSTDVAIQNRIQGLVLGAPRYQHTGKVVMFRKTTGNWNQWAEVMGAQVSDGEGEVPNRHPGIFPTAGRPPPEHCFWLRHCRCRPLYPWRIGGSQLSPGLRYFGQALSGGQDLTQDGLVDVAVGARGQALLLRSRPVLRVDVSLRFVPPELARAVFDCGEQTVLRREAGEARLCLTVRKSSRDRLDEGDIQSSVTYDLALDPGRLNPRAVFDQTKNRTLRAQQTIGLGENCESVRLLLPECVEESVTPIILRLNFSLLGQPIASSGQLRPVLAEGSQDLFTASLLFEKNCGADSICQDDLNVTFSFSSQQTLVVGTSPDLSVTVTVRNEGEDSYGTMVTFSYPPGLSLRRVSVLQNPRQPRAPRLTCESTRPRSSSCSISHPIFREGAEATFLVTFDVPPTADFGSTLLLSANATSDNIPKMKNAFFQKELPVRYGINVVISSGEQSTSYLNFSASEEKSSHVLQHQYHVNNLGLRSLNVTVTFRIPVELNGLPVWTKAEVVPPQVPSAPDTFLPPPPPPGNCSIAVCRVIQCPIASFQVREELTFTLQGSLSFGWVGQTKQKRLSVLSSATLSFDTERFAQFPGQEGFLTAQTKTVVERYEIYNPLLLIVSSSLGGLVLLALLTAGLYKVGPHLRFPPFLCPPPPAQVSISTASPQSPPSPFPLHVSSTALPTVPCLSLSHPAPLTLSPCPRSARILQAAVQGHDGSGSSRC
uniref:Uncharacterized protein n=1 Tax=Ornithorhynchus anatinus TaxID=9258 RepID=F6X2Y4_ORNAN